MRAKSETMIIKVHCDPNPMESIELIVNKLAARIDAPPSLMPTYGWSEGTGRPHIEVHGNIYNWVVTERGTEIERRVTADLDKLLFWIFSSITSSMASKYELEHRMSGVDSRRLIFKRKLDLIRQLNSAWCEEGRREIELILLKCPFNDDLPNCL